MLEPTVAVQVALRIYSAWQERQKARLQANLLSRLASLEQTVKDSQSSQVETIDALVGKAISIAMHDARKWKLACLAETLNAMNDPESQADVVDSILSILDKIDTRHVYLMRFINSGAPDDSITHRIANDKIPEGAVLDAFTYQSLERWQAKTKYFPEELLWSTVNDLLMLGVLKTSPSSTHSKGRIIMHVNPTGLLHIQSYSFTQLGRHCLAILINTSLAE